MTGALHMVQLLNGKVEKLTSAVSHVGKPKGDLFKDGSTFRTSSSFTVMPD